MHEMKLRIEKAVFKKPLRGFGTQIHVNNALEIQQRKPAVTLQLSDSSSFFNPFQNAIDGLQNGPHADEGSILLNCTHLTWYTILPPQVKRKGG